MRWKDWVLFFVLAISFTACTGLAGEPEIVSTNAPTNMPVQVGNPDELGAVIFAEHCVSCHGETGQGDGPVAIEAGLEIPDFGNRQTSASQSFATWTNTIRLTGSWPR